MSNTDQFKPESISLTPNHVSGRRPAQDTGAFQSSGLQGFLGGSPGAVFVRLAVASLIVGFFLVWLDIHPYQILNILQRFVQRLWDMGFDAVREVGQYVLAGAAIVIPVWFLSRLLKFGGR